jgi:fructose-bisphosphate aldolase class II
MKPTVAALRDTNSFGLIMVSRLEWIKFKAESLEAVSAEYQRCQDPKHTRLHLDHVPVIDEDNLRVPFEDDIARALRVGFASVMVDGSRLSLAENISCTKRIVDLAHAAGAAVEAELGAVMGHEDGPMPPYEELFASGKGFTDPAEAHEFVEKTGVDWLSVAIGNVHGAIAAGKKDQKKIAARLSIERLKEINAATNVPLVLHGGTGIAKRYVDEAIRNGIAKVNVATATRQAYERAGCDGSEKACDAVYTTALGLIRDEFEMADSADILL